MSLLGTFDVGTTGLVAQSLRLNLIASNVANAETAVSADGQAYRSRHVVFQTEARAGRIKGTQRRQGLSRRAAVPDGARTQQRRAGEDVQTGRDIRDPARPAGRGREGCRAFHYADAQERCAA